MDEELSSDARFQGESAPGLTDLGLAYAASAKSLRLLSAVMCARISWFTRSFRLPRPASPESTSKVETVHPHGCGKHCHGHIRAGVPHVPGVPGVPDVPDFLPGDFEGHRCDHDFNAMPLCSCVLSV